MKVSISTATALMIVVSAAASAGAHANYIGYSGAPGSRGACSMMCHHQRDFTPTVTVTGFPASYVPGQQYTVAVAHNDGSSIKQFNASVRIGTGSSNGGTIDAGTNTATYNHSLETNGAHFSSADQNSGIFLWTAPPSGTGEVRLYWAGLQGTGLSNGADTQVVLISAENPTGADDNTTMPEQVSLAQNYPNPFNSRTVIEFTVPEPGLVQIEISNILGQRVFSWTQNVSQAGKVSLIWNSRNESGDDVPSGVYFYRLHAAGVDLTRKMILLR